MFSYQSVRNLSIKNKFTNNIVLAKKRRGIFTKVMKYFHDVSGFHNFFKSVVKRIDRLQINYESELGKKDLN